MSLKGKIPPEVKIQAVEDYLAIRKGSTQIREELGIRLSTFQAWLRKYQTEGPAGLHPKKGFTSYPSSLKLAAVEDYLSGEGSLDAMCRKYGISSHAVLQQWITLYNQGHRDFIQIPPAVFLNHIPFKIYIQTGILNQSTSSSELPL